MDWAEIEKLQSRIDELIATNTQLRAEVETAKRHTQEQIDDKHRVLREYEAEVERLKQKLEASDNYHDFEKLKSDLAAAVEVLREIVRCISPPPVGILTRMENMDGRFEWYEAIRPIKDSAIDFLARMEVRP